MLAVFFTYPCAADSWADVSSFRDSVRIRCKAQNGWWVECLVDIGSLRWDCPTVKLIADSRGRLAARGIFQPGKAFDATPQPDGSIRLKELVEREGPVVKLKKTGRLVPHFATFVPCRGPRRHPLRPGGPVKALGDSSAWVQSLAEPDEFHDP